MSSIIVIERDGQRRSVTAQAGHSIMEAVRDGGVDEMLAICGGCCTCATCHVYVDARFADHFAPASADEDDHLASSSHRKPGSRLSCQLRFAPALDGIEIELAPED